ncbi:hypothetical protein PsorP6_002662 [Peronosclerospora sorghi]|uniref:Uncharacterized protein n=1 Tax=Peronosclerospora sorghi TaxID=230839 RepID=A0ACC0WWP3_9STRA|nr:hypothetical protein PsorP6_002662 [Peronosclerospora sorghi]
MRISHSSKDFSKAIFAFCSTRDCHDKTQQQRQYTSLVGKSSRSSGTIWSRSHNVVMGKVTSPVVESGTSESYLVKKIGVATMEFKSLMQKRGQGWY